MECEAKMIGSDVLVRLTGIASYRSDKMHIDVSKNMKLMMFEADEQEDLHLMIDSGGGYQASFAESETIIRSGHLSEFKDPGFTKNLDIVISITDESAFREMFTSLPSEEGFDSEAFFNMDDKIASCLDVKHNSSALVKNGPLSKVRLSVSVTCSDEASLMIALREKFVDLWGSASGFPTERGDVVMEAVLFSNDNPCPSQCGFQIEDYQDPEIVENPTDNSISETSWEPEYLSF